MTKGYNLWLEWEAYKMLHPEKRQVLEWQEQYYRRFCGRSQNRGEKEVELKDDDKAEGMRVGGIGSTGK